MTPDQWWATFALGAVVGVALIIAFLIGASAWREAREVEKLTETDDGID